MHRNHRHFFRRAVASVVAAVMTLGSMPLLAAANETYLPQPSNAGVMPTSTGTFNAQGGVWFETAFAYWTGNAGQQYDVFVSGGHFVEEHHVNGSYVVNVPTAPAPRREWTNDHSALVRLVDDATNLWRVDMPGLPGGASYTLRIVERGTGNEQTITNLAPPAFDRQGFAFATTSPFGSSSIPEERRGTTGAYYANGSLRSDAVVIYITPQNRGSFANPWNTTAGMGGIFNSSQVPNRGHNSTANVSLFDSTPLAIRFVGVVPSTGDWIPVNRTSNVTIEGIGTGSGVNGSGFNIVRSSNMVVRNMTIRNHSEDAINVQGDTGNNHASAINNRHDMLPDINNPARASVEGNTKSVNTWITHNYFVTAVDNDSHVDYSRSTYFTQSYNIFGSSGRNFGGLAGNGVNNPHFRGTYHHNHYRNIAWRAPRLRASEVHVFNNFYEGGGATALVGVGHRSSTIVEGNYFLNARNPIVVNGQGAAGRGNPMSTDVQGFAIHSLMQRNDVNYNARRQQGLSAADLDRIYALAATLEPNTYNNTTLDHLAAGLPAATSTRPDQQNRPFQWNFGTSVDSPIRPGNTNIEAPGFVLNDRETWGALMPVRVDTAAEARQIVTDMAGPMRSMNLIVLPNQDREPPEVPANVSAVITGDDRVIVNWNPDRNADGFEVQWRVGTEGTWTQVAAAAITGTSYSPGQTIQLNQTFQFQVRALDDNPDNTYTHPYTEWSKIVSVTLSTPAAPANVQASAIPSGIHVSWEYADLTPATTFRVRVTPETAGQVAPFSEEVVERYVVGVTNVEIRPLDIGSYTVSVTARAGTHYSSAVTDVVAVDEIQRVAIAAPVISLNGLTLMWNDVDGAANYQVYRNDAPYGDYFAGTSVSLLALGLEPGTNNIQVRALAAEDSPFWYDSALSNTVNPRFGGTIQFGEPTPGAIPGSVAAVADPGTGGNGTFDALIGPAVAAASGFDFNITADGNERWRVITGDARGLSTNSNTGNRITLSNLPIGDFVIEIEVRYSVGANRVVGTVVNTAEAQRSSLAPQIAGGGALGTVAGGQDLATTPGEGVNRSEEIVFTIPVTGATESTTVSFFQHRGGGSDVNALPRMEIRSITAHTPSEEEVTFSAVGGGMVAAVANEVTINSPATLTSGTNVTFTATPNSGYLVTGWTVNGVEVTGAEATAATLTRTVISGGVGLDVQVTFAPITTHNVTFSATGNGAIAAAIGGTAITSGQVQNIASTVVFTATPESGYRVASWTVNGDVVTGETGTTLTRNVPDGGLVVVVTFVVIPPATVTFGANIRAINAATNAPILTGAQPPQGTVVTFIAEPPANQHVTGWTVTGGASVPIGASSVTRTLTSEGLDVNATFAETSGRLVFESARWLPTAVGLPDVAADDQVAVTTFNPVLPVGITLGGGTWSFRSGMGLQGGGNGRTMTVAASVVGPADIIRFYATTQNAPGGLTSPARIAAQFGGNVTADMITIGGDNARTGSDNTTPLLSLTPANDGLTVVQSWFDIDVSGLNEDIVHTRSQTAAVSYPDSGSVRADFRIHNIEINPAPAAPDTTVRLEAPVLSNVGNVLNWTAVDGAVGYQVYMNGAAVGETITATTLDVTTHLPATGSNTGAAFVFAVRALAEAGGDVEDSPLSNTVSISAPRTRNGGVITFGGDVAGAVAEANTGNSSGTFVGLLGDVVNAATGFDFVINSTSSTSWRVRDGDNDWGLSVNASGNFPVTLSNLPIGDFYVEIHVAYNIAANGLLGSVVNNPANQRARLGATVAGGGTMGTVTGGIETADFVANQRNLTTFIVPVTNAGENTTLTFNVHREGGTGADGLPRMEVRTITVTADQTERLDTPVISLDGYNLTWAAVDGAVDYRLYYGNATRLLGNVTSFDLAELGLAAGSHSIRLRAIAAAAAAEEDSLQSTAVTLTTIGPAGTVTFSHTGNGTIAASIEGGATPTYLFDFSNLDVGIHDVGGVRIDLRTDDGREHLVVPAFSGAVRQVATGANVPGLNLQAYRTSGSGSVIRSGGIGVPGTGFIDANNAVTILRTTEALSGGITVEVTGNSRGANPAAVRLHYGAASADIGVMAPRGDMAGATSMPTTTLSHTFETGSGILRIDPWPWGAEDRLTIQSIAIFEGEVEAGTADVTSGQRLPVGTEVTFVATPADGYIVRRWYVNDVQVTGAEETAVTLVREVTAAGLNVRVEFVSDSEAITFLCENFEAYVRLVTDTPTGNIYPTDVAGIRFVDVAGWGITDLTGIQHFAALTRLSARDNELTGLDVSGNTNLTFLDVRGNVIPIETDVLRPAALELDVTFLFADQRGVGEDLPVLEYAGEQAVATLLDGSDYFSVDNFGPAENPIWVMTSDIFANQDGNRSDVIDAIADILTDAGYANRLFIRRNDGYFRTGMRVFVSLDEFDIMEIRVAVRGDFRIDSQVIDNNTVIEGDGRADNDDVQLMAYHIIHDLSSELTFEQLVAAGITANSTTPSLLNALVRIARTGINQITAD